MRGPENAPLHLRLPARAESIALLRERARVWLENAGAERHEIFDVTLAMTEAFANAVEHPHGRSCPLVDVNGSITDVGVMVSVRDYGTWADGTTQKANGGLGLVMIEALMDALRVERLVGGTTVTMQRSLARR